MGPINSFPVPIRRQYEMALAGLGLRAPPVGRLSVSATDRSFVVSVRTELGLAPASSNTGRPRKNRPACFGTNFDHVVNFTLTTQSVSVGI